MQNLQRKLIEKHFHNSAEHLKAFSAADLAAFRPPNNYASSTTTLHALLCDASQCAPTRTNTVSAPLKHDDGGGVAARKSRIPIYAQGKRTSSKRRLNLSQNVRQHFETFGGSLQALALNGTIKMDEKINFYDSSARQRSLSENNSYCRDAGGEVKDNDENYDDLPGRSLNSLPHPKSIFSSKLTIVERKTSASSEASTSSATVKSTNDRNSGDKFENQENMTSSENSVCQPERGVQLVRPCQLNNDGEEQRVSQKIKLFSPIKNTSAVANESNNQRIRGNYEAHVRSLDSADFRATGAYCQQKMTSNLPKNYEFHQNLAKNRPAGGASSKPVVTNGRKADADANAQKRPTTSAREAATIRRCYLGALRDHAKTHLLGLQLKCKMSGERMVHDECCEIVERYKSGRRHAKQLIHARSSPEILWTFKQKTARLQAKTITLQDDLSKIVERFKRTTHDYYDLKKHLAAQPTIQSHTAPNIIVNIPQLDLSPLCSNECEHAVVATTAAICRSSPRALTNVEEVTETPETAASYDYVMESVDANVVNDCSTNKIKMIPYALNNRNLVAEVYQAPPDSGKTSEGISSIQELINDIATSEEIYSAVEASEYQNDVAENEECSSDENMEEEEHRLKHESEKRQILNFYQMKPLLTADKNEEYLLVPVGRNVQPALIPADSDEHYGFNDARNKIEERASEYEREDLAQVDNESGDQLDSKHSTSSIGDESGTGRSLDEVNGRVLSEGSAEFNKKEEVESISPKKKDKDEGSDEDVEKRMNDISDSIYVASFEINESPAIAEARLSRMNKNPTADIVVDSAKRINESLGDELTAAALDDSHNESKSQLNSSIDQDSEFYWINEASQKFEDYSLSGSKRIQNERHSLVKSIPPSVAIGIESPLNKATQNNLFKNFDDSFDEKLFESNKNVQISNNKNESRANQDEISYYERDRSTGSDVIFSEIYSAANLSSLASALASPVSHSTPKNLVEKTERRELEDEDEKTDEKAAPATKSPPHLSQFDATNSTRHLNARAFDVLKSDDESTAVTQATELTEIVNNSEKIATKSDSEKSSTDSHESSDKQISKIQSTPSFVSAHNKDEESTSSSIVEELLTNSSANNHSEERSEESQRRTSASFDSESMTLNSHSSASTFASLADDKIKLSRSMVYENEHSDARNSATNNSVSVSSEINNSASIAEEIASANSSSASNLTLLESENSRYSENEKETKYEKFGTFRNDKTKKMSKKFGKVKNNTAKSPRSPRSPLERFITKFPSPLQHKKNGSAAETNSDSDADSSRSNNMKTPLLSPTRITADHLTSDSFSSRKNDSSFFDILNESELLKFNKLPNTSQLLELNDSLNSLTRTKKLNSSDEKIEALANTVVEASSTNGTREVAEKSEISDNFVKTAADNRDDDESAKIFDNKWPSEKFMHMSERIIAQVGATLQSRALHNDDEPPIDRRSICEKIRENETLLSQRSESVMPGNSGEENFIHFLVDWCIEIAQKIPAKQMAAKVLRNEILPKLFPHHYANDADIARLDEPYIKRCGKVSHMRLDECRLMISAELYRIDAAWLDLRQADKECCVRFKDLFGS